MAFIDYGALLRVDGVFLNMNADLFMDSSETGYVCNTAIDEDGNVHQIDGNYYVYAGDENLMLCFYKGTILVISRGKIIKHIYATPFEAETYSAIPGISELKISHLDKQLYHDDYFKKQFDDYYDYLMFYDVSRSWTNYRKYCRMVKSFARSYARSRERTFRFLAEWDYDHHHYEVIFGYGIDPSRETWDEIKSGDSYGFTETERKIIDEWFSVQEEKRNEQRRSDA